MPVLIMIGLLALGSGACATTGTPVPRPFPGATVVGTRTSGRSPAATVPGQPSPDAVASTAGEVPAPVDPAVRSRGDSGDNVDLMAGRLDGRAVAQFALGFRGVPYRLGGADPAGFDCSGLVQYVFAQYGIWVPRVVEQQYVVGEKIDPSDIKPGDLIFFNTKKRGASASHVGIAIGEDQFVHAPNSTGVVRVETLASSYWGSRYIGARRVTRSSTSN